MDEVRTSGIPLSEARPCDFCKGKIAPIFYVITIKHAFFGKGANQTLGMFQFFGGMQNDGQDAKRLAIAENFSPNADRAIVVSEDDRINTQLFICQDCYLRGPVDLAVIAEKRHKETEPEEEKANG